MNSPCNDMTGREGFRANGDANALGNELERKFIARGSGRDRHRDAIRP